MQPIGEASGEAPEEEEKEKEEPKEYEEAEDEKLVGKIAYKYLSKPFRDKTFGVRKEKSRHFIGNQEVIIEDNDIILTRSDEIFRGTPGLWELITSKDPRNFTDNDYNEYKDLMLLTSALYRDYNPKNPHPRGSRSLKWMRLLSPIWHRQRVAEWRKEGYEGKGIVIMSIMLLLLLCYVIMILMHC